ncbi:MAG TPA: Ldh family oxidoreductase [Candidatus Dormibacteraeota bacterium]|jgi:LDH2 family malate/lactate/ureidoglycolate dehydrogenase|nr:Ldh family oxidoreductase [Candidatus Dormibacteraeota bacterium]
MSLYPGTEREQRVNRDALADLVTEIFRRCGESDDDAALIADTLVTADLQGVHSHGTYRVPGYVQRLTEPGGIDPKGRPHITKDHGAAFTVDGGNAMGQVATAFAMRTAIDRARGGAVGVAAVGGSNHCGAMAYYARMAVDQEMIGIATTNAMPIMAPWGGLDRLIGINPLSIGIPTADEPPFIIDTSFAMAAQGKVQVYKQKGLPIPADWGFDAEGRPTTDPAKVVLMQPVGGYKGVGLAVAMGLLSTLLSGADYGTELADPRGGGATPGHDGQFVVAINGAAFGDLAEMNGRVDGVLQQLRGSRRATGAGPIYSPGEPERDTELAYLRDGIPLNDETLEGLRTAAARLEVEQELIRPIQSED